MCTRLIMFILPSNIWNEPILGEHMHCLTCILNRSSLRGTVSELNFVCLSVGPFGLFTFGGHWPSTVWLDHHKQVTLIIISGVAVCIVLPTGSAIAVGRMHWNCVCVDGGIHLHGRTQGVTAEHCTVTGLSRVFTGPVNPFVVAYPPTACEPSTCISICYVLNYIYLLVYLSTTAETC